MTAATAYNNAMGPAGLGIGPSAGPPLPQQDLRLSVPVTTAPANQSTSWHQPAAHYSTDHLSATGRGAWFPADNYMNASPGGVATGMPGQPQSYQPHHQQSSQAAYQQQRMPAMNAHSMDMPPQFDGHQGQPTSSS